MGLGLVRSRDKILECWCVGRENIPRWRGLGVASPDFSLATPTKITN